VLLVQLFAEAVEMLEERFYVRRVLLGPLDLHFDREQAAPEVRGRVLVEQIIVLLLFGCLF
jgi:hypothetical protein